jgi:hypothetical protein
MKTLEIDFKEETEKHEVYKKYIHQLKALRHDLDVNLDFIKHSIHLKPSEDSDK